uniref:Uncharacterized protein n=1 Tax=Vitis vinifera TaxID=29760 RepID=F6I1V0_VITVI
MLVIFALGSLHAFTPTKETQNGMGKET